MQKCCTPVSNFSRKSIRRFSHHSSKGSMMTMTSSKGRENLNCGSCSPPTLKNGTLLGPGFPSNKAHYSKVQINFCSSISPLSQWGIFKWTPKKFLVVFLKWAKWYWACKTLLVGNGAGSQQDSPQTTRLRLSPDAVALCQVRSNSFEEVDPHHNLGKYAWSVTNSEEKRLVFWLGKL